MRERVFNFESLSKKALRERSTLALKDKKNVSKWHHEHTHKV